MNVIRFAVIFDMDGTLFQTEKILVPALHKTFDRLRSAGEWKGETPVQKYLKILGGTLPEVWRQLLPDAAEKTREEADKWFLEYLIEEIQQGNGELYPEVMATLEQLKKNGIPLFVASNGLERYIDAINQYFSLGQYIIDFYSVGRFQCTSKSALVGKLLKDYRIEKAIMIGDRISDIQAAKDNKLWSVGCQFGFADHSELAEADYIVNQFSEIVSIVQRIWQKADVVS
ncbi:HAD superfamily hydrolase (TIGR01549 family) [Anoxybacillus calidus]|jgi:phosphoglycolate phosphatase|uniref:HAD superfamily hydrolase (TIGR01549 family) n=1 Tax=[Anoxybacillus] calidus TaxID=575178 RepID=A0A7V9Z2W5_9BACL|nr:HAD-IA family hydrolase [Anoxybacillus calidus]MBA2872938.1 HAD superfamily hydrolase (TIGR01549 family) [Anoxybacillus calidus]